MPRPLVGVIVKLKAEGTDSVLTCRADEVSDDTYRLVVVKATGPLPPAGANVVARWGGYNVKAIEQLGVLAEVHEGPRSVLVMTGAGPRQSVEQRRYLRLMVSGTVQIRTVTHPLVDGFPPRTTDLRASDPAETFDPFDPFDPFDEAAGEGAAANAGEGSDRPGHADRAGGTDRAGAGDTLVLDPVETVDTLEIVNLSEGGVLGTGLVTGPLHEGRRVELTLRTGDLELTAEAEVVRADRLSSRHAMVGLSFVGLAPGAADRIRALLFAEQRRRLQAR